MRLLRLFSLVVAAVLLVAGCGSGSGSGSGSDTKGSGSSSPSAHSSSGHSHDAMDMSATGDKPTETASMICGDEIQDAVRRTFELPRQPRPTSSWDKSTRVFSCTYAVPGGDLEMSVQDATDPARGKSYFADLRSRLDEPRTIKGMENFGFPAFDTAAGDVVFIKDGKTLHVDATGLKADDLPAGYDRSEAAYSIASAVIGCWTE